MGETTIHDDREETPSSSNPKGDDQGVQGELAEQAKAAEEEHRITELIKNHIPAVFFCIGKLRVPGDLYEDCISDGFLQLYLCAKSFDPTLGFTFNTYAITSIRRRMISVIKRRSPRHRHLGTSLAEIDIGKLEENVSFNDIDPTESFPEVDRIPIDILNPLEKSAIFCYFFENMTLAEIGKKLNKSHQRVHQIKDEALRKLRKELNIGDI